jgi:hypothetical protein
VGSIDYSLTNKMPLGLRKAIAEGKKILVLINPPYAEATNRTNISLGEDTKTKAGVAKTKIAATAMSEYGKASNELFAQFVARIAIEIPNATLAMFSTMKYVNAPNFEKFREVWSAKFLGGFAVHNQAFDGLTGKFPIGFLIWETNHRSNIKIPITEITVEVLNKEAKSIGEKKFYNLANSTFLNVWLKRPKANKIAVLPIKNAISPMTAVARVKTWADNAIAYMHCGVNDLQHAEQETTLYSSVFGSGNGFYVTTENLWQATVIFSVRRLIKPTWLNDRDQFLQPTQPLSDEFKSDCLIWMLFNRCQRTAGANDLEWNDKSWSLVNHFIPFTEAEVGAPDRFESDFMVQYLAELPPLVGWAEAAHAVTQAEPDSAPRGQKNLPTLRNSALSADAQSVLDAGRTLWQAYFAHTDVRTVRDELKLNRPDVGWYQIRNALKKRNESGDTAPVDFTPFESAYKTLSEKLQPQVFELGFLR